MTRFVPLFSLFASISLFSSFPASATAIPPSVDSFFRDPEIRTAVLSPKGNYVALLTKGKNDRYVLAVRDTADPNHVSIVAAAGEWDIVEVHWVNENRLMFTRRDLKDPLIPTLNKNGVVVDDHHGNRDQFAVNRDGSELLPLISGWSRYHQDATGSNAKNQILERSFSYFGHTNDDSDDVIVKKSFYNRIDPYPEYTRLYRFNTKTRVLAEALEGNQPKYATQWVLDTKDVPRIASSEHDGRCMVSYRAPGEDSWKEIDNANCLSGEGIKAEYFDGQGGLYVSTLYKGYSALFKFDTEKKQIASQPTLSLNKFDYSGTRIYDYEKNAVVGIDLKGDARSTTWFDPKLTQIQTKVDDMLPGRSNIITCGNHCLSAPAMLVASTSDRQPTQYLLYNVANGSLIKIGDTKEDIKAQEMGVRQFTYFTARDGRQIPVYVTLPPGKPTGPQPTVIYLHGGPNMREFSWEWEDESQFLASRGYVVIQPEFRGSLGFGYDHYHAGWKQFGQAMQDDVTDSTMWAIQKGWADPKRIAVLGMSYGGYSTLMGLIQNPDLYRCGVAWSAITDLAARYTSPDDDATREVLHYILPATMGDPDSDAKMLKDFSPVTRAAELKQPLLLAHGTQDRRIPIGSANRFHDAVSKTNSNVQWQLYPDEYHGIVLEANRIDFWKRVEAFLNTNLKTVN